MTLTTSNCLVSPLMVAAQRTTNRPVQLPSLTTVPHLHPLRIRKHSHNNLLDKTTSISPTVLRSPPEITGNMGG